MSFAIAPAIDLSPIAHPHREALLAELAGGADIPMLPAIAREVMAMAEDPEVPVRRIANVLRRDPALAAQLLKAANSAFYGTGRRVGALPEAIVRVGARGLRQLLWSAAAGRLLVVRGRPALSTRLQARSTAVAIAASQVGGAYGTDVEGAFLAGLLHDVGWAVIYGIAARPKTGLPAELCADPARVDALALAMHQEVGETLARAWNLPPHVTAAIGFHHHPEDASAGALMAYVVAASVRIVDYLGIGPVEADEGNLAADPVLRRLGLDPERVAAIGMAVTEGMRTLPG